MNNILPLLLTLFISFNQIYGNNVTTPTTTGPGASTTKMYTSPFETLPGLTDMDPMPTCIFEYEAVLEPSEGIDITVCGYKSSNGQGMVEITFDLPLDRWVGVGFILPGRFNESKKMTNVYTFIIPAYKREVQERYMLTNGNIGDLLEKTTEIDEDRNEDGQRILTITRNVSISIDGLTIDYKQDFSKYFNFTKFSQCDEKVKVLWAFAKLKNDPISFHGSNAKAIDAVLTYRNQKKCAEDGTDGDIRNTPLSIICIVIMSIIAILFN